MGVFPKQELNDWAEKFDGRMGFYAQNLSSGETYRYHEKERFPTASVFKLAVMVALFREAERGAIDLDERRRLEVDISTHGSGMLCRLTDQPELTLRDYCRLMIAISDNMATDMLVRAVGAPRINAIMRDLGITDTNVMEIGRWHYMIVGMQNEPFSKENDSLAIEKGKAGGYLDSDIPYSDSIQNLVSSPHDMGTLLEKLYKGELADKKNTQTMLDFLLSSTNVNLIRGPVRTDIKVGHKYGSSRRIIGDAGIVFLSQGPIVIAAFTLSNTPEGKQAGGPTIEKMTALIIRSTEPEALKT